MNDIESLLAANPSPTDSGLREKLLRQTTGKVRGRRWRRRGRIVAALAVCYLAGVATLEVLHWRPEPVRVETVRAVPEPKLVVMFLEPAAQLERRAEQAEPDEQAREYFAAGKRYAAEAGDWDSTLRCYRNALDADPRQAERLDPENDDWLAMALKLDRQKERENANATK